MKISKDLNGNKVLKIESSDLNGNRGFSVQTLGNLPLTHRDGIGKYTLCELKMFLSNHGTKSQKSKIDCRLFRMDYMNGSRVSHSFYYRQFVTSATLEFVKTRIGLEKLKQSKDEHLNDIVKHNSRGGWVWDNAPVNINLARELKECTHNGSPAFRTCVAKQAAYMLLEQSNEV